MIEHTASPVSTPVWPWLFPSTLALHIAEEYWGGVAFAHAPSSMKGVNLTPGHFLWLTGLSLALMTAGIFLARRLRFLQSLLVILGTVVLINGLSHTINSAVKVDYNPGLISGLLIWIPLGIVTLIRLKPNMKRSRYWTGVAIGVAIHGIISLVAHGKNPFSA